MTKFTYICKDCGKSAKCKLTLSEGDSVEPAYCPYSSLRRQVNWKLKKEKNKELKQYPIGYCLSCEKPVFVGEFGICKPTCDCKDISHSIWNNFTKDVRTTHGDILRVCVSVIQGRNVNMLTEYR